MNLQEFKSWFEGYTEDMASNPTEKQWTKIKEKVKQIDGVAITYHNYHNYWRPYYQHPYYPTYPFVTLCGGTRSMVHNSDTVAGEGFSVNNFVSTTAMYSLGKADWISETKETIIEETVQSK